MGAFSELAIEMDEGLHPTLGEPIPCSCCGDSNGCGCHVTVTPGGTLIHLASKELDGVITSIMLTPLQALQVAMLLQEAALDVRGRDNRRGATGSD